jgi:hypothetical protein
MSSTLRIATLATGAVVLALVGGCSGGNGPTGSGTVAVEDSPLSAYWDQIGSSQDEVDADAQNARSEDIVAACMQDQGFEYTPQDTSGTSQSVDEDDALDWESLEFAQQYGYGATTWNEMPGNQGDADEYVDPNSDYVNAMSESEQQAYYEALYGAQPEEPVDEEAEPQEYDWTTAGCQGKAQHEVYEEGQVWDDPEFKELTAAMSELYENVESDARMVAAYAPWVECMADEGYDFANPTEAQNSIYDVVNELPYDEETGMQDPAKLAELREQEIATATADRTCMDSTGATQKILKVQFAMEQEFVDAHKDQLDAMVAKAAQAAK